MKSQTVLVSGASGNLGKAVSERFLQAGWNVVGVVHHAGNSSFAYSEKYREFEVDLTNETDAGNCVKKILEIFGTIDVAVLTVGGFRMGTLESTTSKDIQQQFELNFVTAYNFTRPILVHFRRTSKGKIFFVGSGQGLDTGKGKTVVAYSLSKSLLFQLANIINAGFGGTSVSARVIVPEIIDTPQNRKDMPDADFNEWQKPEDIASVIEDYSNRVGDSKKNAVIIKEELSLK